MDNTCPSCMYEDCGVCTVGRKPKRWPKKQTCKRYRPKYEGYDTNTVHKRIKSDLERLVSKSNSWDRIVDYIKNDSRARQYLEQIQDDMLAANNQSQVVMIISTVDLILEKITEYEEEYGDV